MAHAHPAMQFLIIDDHALIRTGLCNTLASAYPEATIQEADSGEQMLGCLRQRPDMDLACMDLYLERADQPSFDLLQRIRKDYPRLRLLILSASVDAGHVRQALSMGAMGYVSKSESPDTLLQAIAEILAGGMHIPMPEQLTMETLAPSPEHTDLDRLLTPRQMEVLAKLGAGKSNKVIGAELGLSENTVKVHVSAILRQLDLDNRSQAGLLSQRCELPGR